jgi:hypothetical protein
MAARMNGPPPPASLSHAVGMLDLPTIRTPAASAQPDEAVTLSSKKLNERSWPCGCCKVEPSSG